MKPFTFSYFFKGPGSPSNGSPKVCQGNLIQMRKKCALSQHRTLEVGRSKRKSHFTQKRKSWENVVVLAAGQQREGQKEREREKRISGWTRGKRRTGFPYFQDQDPKKEEWVGSLGTNAGVSGFGGLQPLLTCKSVPSPGSGRILGFFTLFFLRTENKYFLNAHEVMFEIWEGKRFSADLLSLSWPVLRLRPSKAPFSWEEIGVFLFERETRKLVHVVTPPRPPPIGNLTLEIWKEKRGENEKRQEENAHRPLDADAIQDDVNKSE